MHTVNLCARRRFAWSAVNIDGVRIDRVVNRVVPLVARECDPAGRGGESSGPVGLKKAGRAILSLRPPHPQTTTHHLHHTYPFIVRRAEPRHDVLSGAYTSIPMLLQLPTSWVQTECNDTCESPGSNWCFTCSSCAWG